MQRGAGTSRQGWGLRGGQKAQAGETRTSLAVRWAGQSPGTEAGAGGHGGSETPCQNLQALGASEATPLLSE